MVRSVTDATRFTATGPYATSKSASRASTIALSSPAPPNETKQQKVARLREAARRAKLGQESNFDKVVARGRVWADRAHRFTALGLIGFTGIAGIVTVASLGDMILYNRKKRKEWFAEQREKHMAALAVAHEAAAQGTADEDQMLLINQERAAQESAQARSQKKGMFGRAKEYLFGGLAKEEEAGQRSSEPTLSAVGERIQPVAREESSHEPGQGLGILKAVEETRRVGEKAQPHVTGGPLDRLAEEAASGAKDTSKSWASWMSRR